MTEYTAWWALVMYSIVVTILIATTFRMNRRLDDALDKEKDTAKQWQRIVDEMRRDRATPGQTAELQGEIERLEEVERSIPMRERLAFLEGKYEAEACADRHARKVEDES